MMHDQIAALQQKMLARDRQVIALYNQHIAGYAPEVESETKILSAIMQQIMPEVPALLALCSASERATLTAAMAEVTDAFSALSPGVAFQRQLDAVIAAQQQRLSQHDGNPAFDALSADWPRLDDSTGRLPDPQRSALQHALQYEADCQREAWQQQGYAALPPVAVVLLDPNDAVAMKNAHRYLRNPKTGEGIIHLPENSPRLKTPADALFFVHQEAQYHVQDFIIGSAPASEAAQAFMLNDYRPTVWGNATFANGMPNSLRREAQKSYEAAFPRRVAAGKIGAAAAATRGTDADAVSGGAKPIAAIKPF